MRISGQLPNGVPYGVSGCDGSTTRTILRVPYLALTAHIILGSLEKIEGLNNLIPLSLTQVLFLLDKALLIRA